MQHAHTKATHRLQVAEDGALSQVRAGGNGSRQISWRAACLSARTLLVLLLHQKGLLLARRPASCRAAATFSGRRIVGLRNGSESWVSATGTSKGSVAWGSVCLGRAGQCVPSMIGGWNASVLATSAASESVIRGRGH